MCTTGGARRVLVKYAEQVWQIPTEHFDPDAVRNAALRSNTSPPLDEILVRGSTPSRARLKERLYREGLKQRACELCGQGEQWHGRRMSLILDHVNGDATDNRLENLRIVCPNCNATLETHCGRNARLLAERSCAVCGASFWPKRDEQRHCSRRCGQRADRSGRPQLALRRAERPPREQLLAEIDELGYSAVGRRYGVSDNAIRKWVRFYEREGAGVSPAR